MNTTYYTIILYLLLFIVYYANKCKQGVDYTSPALCTSVTPFQADPIFSKRAATE